MQNADLRQAAQARRAFLPTGVLPAAVVPAVLPAVLPAIFMAALGMSNAAFGQVDDAALPAVEVRSVRSVAEKNQLPNTTESITAERLAETVNATGVEDALKYLPSILVRKRYPGDTQAPMATRTTGINAGARSLIYVDGLLLSTLINNNNANGSPQWFMLSPDEVQRIDVLYGPFAAAYPGNAYGAVTEITTRMPTRFEGSARIGFGAQTFEHYATRDTYRSRQAAVSLGNRSGGWAWRLDASRLDSDTQPLGFLTLNQSAIAAGAALPAVSGAIADRNRSGGAIAVVGASGLTHTAQETARVKLTYDVSPDMTASYTVGYWQNQADSASNSYLRSATGAPYYGGSGTVALGGNAYGAATIGTLFSSNRVEQSHWMQSLGLRAKVGSEWNWELGASSFDFGHDVTRTSTAPYPAALGGGAGRIADAGGTGWQTLDAKAFYRPREASAHALSFGAHADQYQLDNPSYDTADWLAGSSGRLVSTSRGKTRTGALWAQDLWQLSPALAATLGLRHESWRAFDGYNFATAASGAGFPLVQPEVQRSGWSPKAALAWQADQDWSVTGSLGRALRFPTVGELYQNLQTGTTFTRADPFLQPEKVWSAELAMERRHRDGKIRLSLFQENVASALIAQTAALPGSALPVSFVQNVDRTRQRGVEAVFEQRDAIVSGLDIDGSVTYVDARILANASFVPSVAGATSAGRRTPYVPAWRGTLVATYRPDAQWSWTLAGRASSRLYATVDNSDVNPATYQGFQAFFVADARVRYRFDRQWSAALGVDNLNNRDYFLFHPFPQRTAQAELKFEY